MLLAAATKSKGKLCDPLGMVATLIRDEIRNSHEAIVSDVRLEAIMVLGQFSKQFVETIKKIREFVSGKGIRNVHHPIDISK